MAHVFGDLLTQHLHRKHGLSQAKLAAGILQDPAIIAKMCKGERLNGVQARERIVAIIGWLNKQGTLETVGEANTLLIEAGHAPLRERAPNESELIRLLNSVMQTAPRPGMHMARQIKLPNPNTLFVGRTGELVKIDQLLSDARCRLLSLVGPGGVGKTRLAIEAAAARVNACANNVVFVDLQAVADASYLPFAIAEALSVALSGSAPPLKQLENYLANKHLLLILDNFEHLIDGATTLSTLLTSAPQVQLLVTSREVLNLSEEWQFRVDGIAFPSSDQAENPDALACFDAVHLFVERAQRVQPDFALERALHDVARICRLIEGMPLAIEMASAWTKTLSCAEIAHELENGLAILSSRLRNAPPRHRSMEAAFEHSWKMLNAQEQTVFQRLSVFRGGFTKIAAAQVAEAGLEELTSLVDKSFLQCAPNGRYKVHELLRQYGGERLAESADDYQKTHAKHGRYFANFVSERIRPHTREIEFTALQACRMEMDNLRTAWRWSVETCDLEVICRSAAPLYWLAQYEGSYLEGFNTLQSAASRIAEEVERTETRVAAVEVLPYLAWLALRLGRLEECETACRKCLSLQQQFDIAPRPGWGNSPLAILSIISAIGGDNVRAELLAQQDRHLCQEQGQISNLPVAFWAIANAVLAQGRMGEARSAVMEAIDLCRQFRMNWFLAYCLNTLGSIEMSQGNLQNASALYQESYELRELFDDAEGMAVALINMGEVAMASGNPAMAQQRYARSYDLYRNLNDRGGLAMSLKSLGDAACKQGLFTLAGQHYQIALQTAQEMNYVSLVLSLFQAIGELFIQTRREGSGTRLLTIGICLPGQAQAIC